LVDFESEIKMPIFSIQERKQNKVAHG